MYRSRPRLRSRIIVRSRYRGALARGIYGSQTIDIKALMHFLLTLFSIPCRLAGMFGGKVMLIGGVSDSGCF